MFVEYDGFIIRNAQVDDAGLLGNWWRDGNIMAHAGFPNGLTISDAEIVQQLSGDSDYTVRRLIIEKDKKPIGEMSYRNMGEGVAQIGVKICETNMQGKGYGAQFLYLLINSLFKEYNFSKIVLDTNLNNTRAQHVYEKIGFIKSRINIDSWKNQLGELQSSVDYELEKSNFHMLYNKILVSKICVRASTGIKAKSPNEKRPFYEKVFGFDFSKSLKKLVNKICIIDRRQDKYYEKLVDPVDNKIIHECEEPLSAHRHHGSDKGRK
jgi:RimJ/RimL family protein N-acetyltransferase